MAIASYIRAVRWERYGAVHVFSVARDPQDHRLLECFYSAGAWRLGNQGGPEGFPRFRPRIAAIDGRVFLTGIENGRLYELGPYPPAAWLDHGTGAGDDQLLLSSEAAVVSPSGYVGLFVQGKSGRIYERYLDGGSWFWTDHGELPGKVMPNHEFSVVATDSGYVGMFAEGADGNLFERYFDNGWHWLERGALPARAKGGLTAVGRPATVVRVFRSRFRGGLYEAIADSNWHWIDHGQPPQAPLTDFDISSVATPSGYVGVFLIGLDRHLHERYLDQGRWYWTDHGALPNGSHPIAGPSAVAGPSGQVTVVLMDVLGQLHERYYDCGWHWRLIGDPTKPLPEEPPPPQPPPQTPRTETLKMEGQPVWEGLRVYQGTFQGAGILQRLEFPRQWMFGVVCRLFSERVTLDNAIQLAQGGTATGEQLEALYGSQTPSLPLTFRAYVWSEQPGTVINAFLLSLTYRPAA